MKNRFWISLFCVSISIVGCSSDGSQSLPSTGGPALTGDDKADCETVCKRGVPACPKYTSDQDVQVCVDVCLEMAQGNTDCQDRFQDWLICVTSSPIVCSESGTGEWEGEATGCYGFKDWPSPCPCAPISDCENMGEQIKQVASTDAELTAEQKNDPCVEPVPMTSSHNYGPPCATLKKCLCEGCNNCRSFDGG